MVNKVPTIVHVNRHKVTKNKKNKTNEPDIVVRKGRSGKSHYAHSVDILDEQGKVVATLSSHRDKPLSCGATIWLECSYGVIMRNDDETTTDLRSESGEPLSDEPATRTQSDISVSKILGRTESS